MCNCAIAEGKELRPYDMEHGSYIYASTVCSRQQLLSVLVTSWCTKQLLSAHDFDLFCEECFGVSTWSCSQTMLREKIVWSTAYFVFVHCGLNLVMQNIFCDVILNCISAVFTRLTSSNQLNELKPSSNKISLCSLSPRSNASAEKRA